jgi:hypothetical protein
MEMASTKATDFIIVMQMKKLFAAALLAIVSLALVNTPVQAGQFSKPGAIAKKHHRHHHKKHHKHKK